MGPRLIERSLYRQLRAKGLSHREALDLGSDSPDTELGALLGGLGGGGGAAVRPSSVGASRQSFPFNNTPFQPVLPPGLAGDIAIMAVTHYSAGGSASYPIVTANGWSLIAHINSMSVFGKVLAGSDVGPVLQRNPFADYMAIAVAIGVYRGATGFSLLASSATGTTSAEVALPEGTQGLVHALQTSSAAPVAPAEATIRTELVFADTADVAIADSAVPESGATEALAFTNTQRTVTVALTAASA